MNLYARLSNFVAHKEIEGVNLKVSSLELALVEAALVSDSAE